MAIVADEDSTLETIKGTVFVFLTLAVVAGALTLLFLGMRSVMSIGGSCAEGGPFIVRQTCPKGIPVLMVGSIWGGLIATGLYVWQAFKHRVPSLALLAWPALFLSLGWNFLDFGLNPPGGGGVVWGWLVCAIIFAAMGGVPLLLVVGPTVIGFTRSSSDESLTYRSIAKVKGLMGTLFKSGFSQSTKSGFSQSTQTSSEPDFVDELERLDRLHRSGALSTEEFEEAKRVLLRGRR